MSITVVGSVGLDNVETPSGKTVDELGGAATYFAIAASNFAPVELVGIVGEDFPERHVELLQSKKIGLDGLERAPGKTFRWAGRYHQDINERDTLDTQLNVFEHFHPKVPEAARASKYLFLANIHPGLQLEVLEQTTQEFTGLDTMNLWIDISLDSLKEVLKRVDAILINDGEARMLTGETNIVRAARAVQKLGPQVVVVKKGEHGALLLNRDEDVFAVPALPLEEVIDPTGAGDSFAGGFMGTLAREGHTDAAALRHAVVYGTVMASFTCESFGPQHLAAATGADVDARVDYLRKLCAF
jgi:sugar/nucleoside kinase (ribokinase family)